MKIGRWALLVSKLLAFDWNQYVYYSKNHLHCFRMIVSKSLDNSIYQLSNSPESLEMFGDANSALKLKQNWKNWFIQIYFKVRVLLNRVDKMEVLGMFEILLSLLPLFSDVLKTNQKSWKQKFIYSSTQIVPKLYQNWTQIRDKANDFRTVEVFLGQIFDV